MDNRSVTGGVKVTYIETQFVTSDAAGFKDLVQRLTGRSSTPPPATAPHRPRPCRPYDGRRGTSTTAAAGAAAGPQGYHHHYTVADQVRPAVAISRTPAYDLEGMDLHDVIDMGDFSDLLFYVGASERSDGGCYGGFPC